MNSLLWSDYTTEELRDIIQKEDPVVIMPIAATEQHGPHLAVNTDTDIGMNVARIAAESCPGRALVLPPVWAGISPHHMHFSGTITLKQSTLFAVICDIAESLIHHGVRRIVLLNSHGGNISLVKTAGDEIAIRHGVYPVCVTYWHLIADVVKDIRRSELGGMAHACELETSLKLLFSPQDVRTDRMRDVMIAGDEFYNVDMFAANKIGIYRPFEYWSETGQIGAPTLASKETGEKLVEALRTKFRRLLEACWTEQQGENRHGHGSGNGRRTNGGRGV
jgi:creatinine amidohydrolase